MARPVIALLTDFGLSDHYAGTMKGVVLGICPDASLVDITHDIPAHDVLTAALELAAAYRYFPIGTVFLVVVDPGVGSTRRALAARVGSYLFVCPDNGVLTFILEAVDGKDAHFVELTEDRYRRPQVSRTFEGRDRFAPAAAWLASGVELTALGPAVDAVQRLDVPRAHRAGQSLEGEVLRVDRFGNLITNIDRTMVEALAGQGALTIRLGGCTLAGIVSTYAEAAPGQVCALFSSSDRLEIAANGASAASALGAVRGTPVRIERGGASPSNLRGNIPRL